MAKKDIPEDAVCFCCRGKAWGYVKVSYHNVAREMTVYMCSRCMRDWSEGKLENIILEALNCIK